MADFDPKSATFGVWLTNGSRSSRSNILRNRFFHEVIEIINEAAAQNTLEGHSGLERFSRVVSRVNYICRILLPHSEMLPKL